jgi:hypothetical protein
LVNLTCAVRAVRHACTGNPVEEKDAKALAKALKRNKKFSIKALLGMD